MLFFLCADMNTVGKVVIVNEERQAPFLIDQLLGDENKNNANRYSKFAYAKLAEGRITLNMFECVEVRKIERERVCICKLLSILM